jgi:hypothetical protein
MKPVKSTTKNASTEFDVEKIRRFTQTELSKLAQTDEELPFCYQIGSDILVGRYRVVKINDKCWQVIEDQKQIFDFFSRKDAIFYCIALHKQQLQLAKNIKDSDKLLNKLEFEATLYRQRYKKAIDNGDNWSEEYYSTRYLEVMQRIETTKKEIKKNLDLAKYIKV